MGENRQNGGFDFVREMWGIIFMALGMFFSLSLISYSPTDPALNAASSVQKIDNLCGIVGAYAADILFTIFGISAYLTSLLFFLLSLMQFFGHAISVRIRDIFFYIGLVAFMSTLIHLRFETIEIGETSIAGGGVVGSLIGELLSDYLNRVGAYVIAGAGSLLFFSLSTHLTVHAIFNGIRRGTIWCSVTLWNSLVAIGDQLPELWSGFLGWLKSLVMFIPSLIQRRREARQQEIASQDPPVHIEQPLRLVQQSSNGTDEEKSEEEEGEEDDEEEEEDEDEDDEDDDGEEEEPAPLSKGGNGPKILQRGDVKKKRISDAQLKFLQMSIEGYVPPPISLLDTEEQPKIEVDEEILKKNSLLLERKLEDFEVKGRVTAIRPGPVITMYEFEPASGTKVNKVVNLEDDLSLTLGGRSVRIIPHLPGRPAVGIEVPNHDREIVWLKDIIASQPFQKSSNKIPLAFGSNTEGNPTVLDLTKMPHLLIAGATGSGKSVAINAMILSILYKMSPEEVRLILIDPKMLELSMYENIPHLLLPVVTKPKQAISAMRWATKEMEKRYRLMADTRTRNIAGYNEKVKKQKVKLMTPEEAATRMEQDPEAVCHLGPIPYIVIIIDELADLMMTSSQEMEETITRLAQMARAAGIHLILATQRPSVDVVTGLIKANFPARIGFKVSARHDSRTILDSIGSEQLLGAGDMLFMSPTGGNITRHHGCYVTEGEIARIVSHVKQQGKPIYDESILTFGQKPEGLEGFEEEDDEMYDRAVQLVTQTRQASISMVQRRLRIGYNRAARMIEKMEAEGVVGPSEGSRPRQVLAQGIGKE